jgi:peptidoglycan/LPS O-acetylase OafA/YrhL
VDAKASGYVKGFIALAVAVLAALTSALTGKTDFSDIDTRTWLIALGAVLASGALTAFVTNVAGVAGGIIKAVIGALGAAVAALVTSLDDQVLTQVELLTALSAFVVGLSLVYQIPEPGSDMESSVVPVTTKTVNR